MEFNVTHLTMPSTRATWTLHHLTDLHIDDPDHAAEELAERIQEIKSDPHALWVGGGDYGSLIAPGDKRFGAGGHLKGEWALMLDRLPDAYLERVCETLEPIKDKCLGLIAGNHEKTIQDRFHRGLVAELAVQLGKPQLYLGDRGWMVVRFKYGTRETSLRLYVFHGWSAGRLKGRKALQAERDLGAWAADVFLLGHDHQPYADIWFTESIEGSKRGYQIRHSPRAVLNGGSWSYGQSPPTPETLKNGWKSTNMPRQSWAAAKNFRPQPPANPVLLVHVDTGHGQQPKDNFKGRPAGFDLEVRQKGSRVYFGE